MPALLTLHEAMNAITEAFDEGDGWDRYAWVYIRGDIAEPSCRLHLSHVGDEEDALINDHGEVMTPFAAEQQLRRYLEATDFAEVLRVQRQRKPQSDLADFARALDHYRRHDAFATAL